MTQVMMNKAKTFIGRSDTLRVARRVAEDKLIRLNPPLFDQYVRYRTGGLTNQLVSLQIIEQWVASYDAWANPVVLTGAKQT